MSTVLRFFRRVNTEEAIFLEVKSYVKVRVAGGEGLPRLLFRSHGQSCMYYVNFFQCTLFSTATAPEENGGLSYP